MSTPIRRTPLRIIEILAIVAIMMVMMLMVKMMISTMTEANYTQERSVTDDRCHRAQTKRNTKREQERYIYRHKRTLNEKLG